MPLVDDPTVRQLAIRGVRWVGRDARTRSLAVEAVPETHLLGHRLRERGSVRPESVQSGGQPQLERVERHHPFDHHARPDFHARGVERSGEQGGVVREPVVESQADLLAAQQQQTLGASRLPLEAGERTTYRHGHHRAPG
jgi:hypothetical protein